MFEETHEEEFVEEEMRTEQDGLENNQDSQPFSENSYSPEFNKSIEGKSPEDLAKMLHESQKQIGKLSQELGNTRKSTMPLPTSERTKKELSSVEQKLKEAKSELDSLDAELDGKDYQKAKQRYETFEKQKEKLRGTYESQKIEEAVEKRFTEEHNKSFSLQMREGIKRDLGLDLDDSTFDFLRDKATILSDSPKLTAEDFEAALIKTLGVDKYRSILQTKGEQQTRMNISQAESKTFVHLGKRTDGRIPMSQLSESERAYRINNMSAAEYAEYKKQRN